MKAIFLCDMPQMLRDVYGNIIEQGFLQNIVSTDVFTKAYVLENREQFKDTKYIFSTWGMPEFTEEEIRTTFPDLECVFYAAGSVQEFARPFINCGVHIFSAYEANAVPVAEYVVAQIMLATKGYFQWAAKGICGRTWESLREDVAHFPGNYKVKIGLIGGGTIARMVMKELKRHDLDVMVYSNSITTEKAEQMGVEKGSIADIFAKCQVVSNHLADNAHTKGILNYELFEKMLPYAVFLNTGRGAQVVEKDLVRALKERADIHAVLDVTYPEPAPADHMFYSLSNCTLTPHIAGSSGNEIKRMAKYMVDEFIRYSENNECWYEISERMLETMA